MFAVLMINLQSALCGRKTDGAFVCAQAGHIRHPLASIVLLIISLRSEITSNHKPKEKLDFNL